MLTPAMPPTMSISLPLEPGSVVCGDHCGRNTIDEHGDAQQKESQPQRRRTPKVAHSTRRAMDDEIAAPQNRQRSFELSLRQVHSDSATTAHHMVRPATAGARRVLKRGRRVGAP